MGLTRRGLLGGALAAGWLGALGLSELSGLARTVGLDDEVLGLAEARCWPWEGGPRDDLEAAFAQNPEYEFMARTFLALALGDLATIDPAGWRDRALRVLDAIIQDTTDSVERLGQEHFLMSYWNASATLGDGRSLFVDGERLMVMAIRRLIADDAHGAASRALAAQVTASLSAGPIGSAESYADECWTFCNALALAALTMMDRLDGTDHRGLVDRWLGEARARLIDRETGMLVSSYTYAGRPMDGPEGSTIWLAAHMLRLLDPDLALEQYALAREALGRTVLGLGYAREWPEGRSGPMDVDSGPIVPGLEASPSSSGLAILAARSFGDLEWFGALRASLAVTALPVEEQGRRRFRASNAVGDAVILAGLVAGPLWKRLAG